MCLPNSIINLTNESQTVTQNPVIVLHELTLTLLIRYFLSEPITIIFAKTHRII